MNSTRLTLSLVIGLSITLAACNNDKPGGSDSSNPSTDDTSAPAEDLDGDGYTTADGDCDDGDANIHPGAAEECNGVDDDCDGDIDEDVQNTYYADTDDDGFGDATATMDACEPTDGWVTNGDDCDDSDSAVYPGAEELCDGIDNDCDNDIDEDLGSDVWYADADTDGWGDPDNSIEACEQPSGYVDNDMDCDDTDMGEPVFVSQTGPVTPMPHPAPPDTADSGMDTSDTSDTGSGHLGTAADPYESIQEGIDNSSVCVYVYAGTYNEDIDYNGNNVVVTGVDGSARTTIQGTGSGPVVTFTSGESAGAQLEGFTITGGAGKADIVQDPNGECASPGLCTTTTYSYYGGGLYIVDSSPSLVDLNVTGNELPPYSYTQIGDYDEEYVYSYGGGMYASNSTSTLNQVTFAANRADSGGGLYADTDSSLSVTLGLFNANLASSGGGMTTLGASTMWNTIFVNNVATGTHNIGGAGFDVPEGTVAATNIAGAGNDGIASFYFGETGSGQIINSILVENEDGFIVEGESGASLTLSYSDLSSSGVLGAYGTEFVDVTGIDGNISANPMFVDWSDDDDYSNDDLHLASGSPAIDAGSPAPLYNDVDGSINDMGAYGGPYGE